MTALRLNFPQWQGGDCVDYYAGSNSLINLAPKALGVIRTVPVNPPRAVEKLSMDQGILARGDILLQSKAAKKIITAEAPDTVVTLGGDCSVSLAPFAWLQERYGERHGVLWVDAHPDVLKPQDCSQAKSHVLATLLGQGNADFLALVGQPVSSRKVMFAGLNAVTAREGKFITQHNLRRASATELAFNATPVLNWIAAELIDTLAIHLDVDVMSPLSFGPTLMNKPNATENYLSGVPRGQMRPAQVIEMLHDIRQATKIVGLTVAEFMPWRAEEARGFLRELPLLAA